MRFFVEENSIVRKIWGKGDTVLFIFAGAAAEFALNKAVDWLYFTGKLPSDPLARLFSTVKYARWIIFSPEKEALKAIDNMHHIHAGIEQNRGYAIPDWAYRDVLFMLVHYSMASYELLERKLTEGEKHDLYDVFYRVGNRMGVKELPTNYTEWLPVRESHLKQNLQKSAYTTDLFKQYRNHLGALRYTVLVEGQKLVVPSLVRKLLGLGSFSFLAPVVPLYKWSRKVGMDGLIKNVLLPSQYKAQIQALDIES